MPLAILALAVGAFGIGTTEFVAMGLLPQMAESFDVSIAAAGWLISAYALGVVVGAPTLTALTHSWPRKRVLTALMGLFVAGHAATALAPGFEALIGARFLSGLSHGAFFGACAVVARKIAPPGRQGQALALVFTGLTVANVVGVPAGTYVGQQLGWRLTFALVGVIGLVTIAAIAVMVPEVETRTGSLRSEFAAFRRGQVWWTLLITTVGFASLFTVLSYVAPLLTEVAGYSEGSVSWVLVLFGLGATFGNLVGGRLADWRPYRTLAVGFVAQAVVFGLLFLFADHAWVAAAGVFSFAFVGFVMSAPIQTRGILAAGGALDGLGRDAGRVQHRQRDGRLPRRSRHRRRLRLRLPRARRARPGPAGPRDPRRSHPRGQERSRAHRPAGRGPPRPAPAAGACERGAVTRSLHVEERKVGDPELDALVAAAVLELNRRYRDPGEPWEDYPIHGDVVFHLATVDGEPAGCIARVDVDEPAGPAPWR